MIAGPKLLAARVKAEAARQRLTGSIEEAKARLRPAALASDAVQGVRAKAGELASEGLDAARRRPAIAAAAVATIGLLVARKPIGRAMEQLGRNDETGSA